MQWASKCRDVGVVLVFDVCFARSKELHSDKSLVVSAYGKCLKLNLHSEPRALSLASGSV